MKPKGATEKPRSFPVDLLSLRLSREALESPFDFEVDLGRRALKPLADDLRGIERNTE